MAGLHSGKIDGHGVATFVVHSAGSARMSRRIIVIVHRHDLRGVMWVRIHTIVAHVIVIG